MNLLISNCEAKTSEEIRHMIIAQKLQIDEIQIANNEAETVELVKQNFPDIIIIDYEKPDLFPDVLIDRIIEISNPQIIMLTGNVSQEMEKTIKNHQCICFPKPVDLNLFKNLLSETINSVKQIKWENRQINTLKQKMDENIPILRDIFFCDLMDGKNTENIAEKMEFSEITIPEGKQYLALCINWLEKKNKENHDGNLSAVAVMQIFKQFLEPYFPAYFIIREKTRVAGILFIDQPGDELKNKLENIFEELCKLVRIRYGIELSVGIGIAATSLEGIYDSYHQACDVLRRGRFAGDGPAFFFSDIAPEYNPSKLKNVVFSNNAKTQIIDYLYAYDTEKMITTLHSELERIYKGILMTEHAVIALKIELSSFLIEHADKIYFDDDKSERDKKYFCELLEQDSITDIENKMVEILLDLAETFYKNRRRRTTKIIEDVKGELDRNLQSGINVQLIAYNIGLSPNYLSAIFKAETGVRLSEYILGIRLEKAQSLLLRSSMKVSEIAELVGCGDQTYFSRLFKKKYGMSPSEYREQGDKQS